MAANLLLNQVSNEFGGDALNRIASTIGESHARIKTALGDILPALLGGLASKAQTREGAHELLDVIHRDHLDTDQYEHVADAIQAPNALDKLMSTGGPLLDTVLPGKSGAVSDWVASHAGIQPATSKSLMSMVLPLLLGLIGRRVGGGGESDLMRLLGKPQTFLQDAPGGLASILGMAGAGAAGAGAGAAAGAATGAAAAAARPALSEIGQRGRHDAAAAAGPSPWSKWLLPLLVLLGLIALMAYYMKRAPAPLAPTVPVATAPAGSGIDLGPFMDRKLPNGVTLHIPANGVENQLIAFIEDPGKQASADTWFSFDRLEFDTSASTLMPASQEQMRNIAEIMKAYPQVRVKFGGYTDNTGNPEQNLQLSRERSSSVMNQVVALGVDASRLTAGGYGEQNPIADNATPEGRQRNRRVDINVTAK